jgi:hypothetical protein
MIFKLGDFVRFIDEKREGYITRVVSNVMVAVTDEDGFEIPVPVSNLTHVHGHKTLGNLDAGIAASTQEPESKFQTEGVYLAVVSDVKLNAVVHFHLINETSYQLLFTLTSEKEKRFKGEFTAIAQPKSAMKVYTAPLNDLALWPRFHFQMIFHSTQAQTMLKKPLVLEEKFKAKDFSGAKKNVKILNQAGWVFPLDEETPLIDPEKLRESLFRGKEELKVITAPEQEIDLHIEKLRDDYLLLNPSEILDIQLTRFRKSMEAAIVHKLDRVVFIHGVGQGVLRNEIHKAMSKNPQVKTFKDARKEKFGYGATEVLLK